MTVQTQAAPSRDVRAFLAEDDLSGALALASEAVKHAPLDISRRLLLIDLLILTGDYERADKQAGMAATMAPKEAVGLSLLRGEIRGMDARSRWYADAAVPVFPQGPTPPDEAALRLALALRSGDEGAASAAAAELDALEPVPMSRDDEPAAEIRDLDDRLPHAFEVVTGGGTYLWIGFRAIARIDFAQSSRPRDLAWRRAQLSLRDGSSAQVLVPALYHSTETSDDALRLGRETRWSDGPGGIVIGHGLRCLMIGDAMVPIMEISSLSMEAGHG